MLPSIAFSSSSYCDLKRPLQIRVMRPPLLLAMHVDVSTAFGAPTMDHQREFAQCLRRRAFSTRANGGHLNWDAYPPTPPKLAHLRCVFLTSYGYLQTPPLASSTLAIQIIFLLIWLMQVSFNPPDLPASLGKKKATNIGRPFLTDLSKPFTSEIHTSGNAESLWIKDELVCEEARY